MWFWWIWIPFDEKHNFYGKKAQYVVQYHIIRFFLVNEKWEGQNEMSIL